MKRVASFGIPLGAIVFGTVLSVALSAWFTEPPTEWPTALALAGGVHFCIIGAFTVMGESLIEDLVKGALVVLLGVFALPHLEMPVVGIAMCSAAVLAIGSNAVNRRLAER